MTSMYLLLDYAAAAIRLLGANLINHQFITHLSGLLWNVEVNVRL